LGKCVTDHLLADQQMNISKKKEQDEEQETRNKCNDYDRMIDSRMPNECLI